MKKQQGFTLIELLIVVAIIGVLSAVAIPAYKNYVKRSEIATGVSTVRALLTNADVYAQENGSFPSSLSDIGAAAAMNSLGNLDIPAASISGSNGTINFTYDNSSINTAEIDFAKTANGWACSVTKNSATITAEDLPKSCSTLN